MKNNHSIESVEKTRTSDHLARPLYESFCFSNIPASVFFLLTGKGRDLALPASCFPPFEERYEKVFLLFIDGFGWSFFEKYQEHPFLQRFLNEGIVSKLTAQFPSTTSAEVTTVHTGLEVGQTGIYEWFQYEPYVDQMISPLLFSYAGDKIAKSLLSTEISPSTFFPFDSIYQKLHEEGVVSYVCQHADLSDSPYSQSMTKQSHELSYFTLKQGLEGLAEVFHGEFAKPVYTLFYYPDIDAKGHRKGVDSPDFEEEVLRTLDALEEWMKQLPAKGGKTAFLLTADHGMTGIDPRKTIYINQEFPKIVSFLKKGAKGNWLVPAGSCRDFFLHVQDEKLEEALVDLSAFFKGRAEVKKVSELISAGFFGSEVSPRFLERVGNLVILPFKGESVWWLEKHRFEQHFHGAHGGMTREELEIPFLFYCL